VVCDGRFVDDIEVMCGIFTSWIVGMEPIKEGANQYEPFIEIVLQRGLRSCEESRHMNRKLLRQSDARV